MTTELQFLIWSCVLGLVQIFIAAGASTQQRGMKWNLSSRDGSVPPLTGAAGRMSRAVENFKETFPIFLAAVVVVQLLAKNSWASSLGVQIYFYARLLYFPIYALDVVVIRTAVFGLSLLGVCFLFYAALV